METEKTCWICYQSEADSSGIATDSKWVSPCRCSGDTKWSHERCLLTWIVRRQVQQATNDENDNEEDGEAEGVVREAVAAQEMNEEGVPPADLGQEHQPQPELQQRLPVLNPIPPPERRPRRRIGQLLPGLFRWLLERHSESLAPVKCPQCGYKYQLQYAKTSWHRRALIKSYELISTFGDLAVPYFIVSGTAYSIGLISISYGVHAVSTVCDRTDLFVRTIMEGPQSWRMWLGLASIPHLLLVLRSHILERTMASISMLTLGYLVAWPGIKERFTLISTNHRRMYLTPLTLTQRRVAIICGLFYFKRLYSAFYAEVLAPWALGHFGARRQRAALPDGSADSSAETLQMEGEEAEQNFAEFQLPIEENRGIIAEGNEIRVSLLDMFKWLVETMMMPSISLFVGQSLRSGCVSVVNSWAGGHGTALYSIMKTASTMDQFNWSIIGGCTYTFAKDAFRLIYSRFRKQQRLKMHVLPYRSG